MCANHLIDSKSIFYATEMEPDRGAPSHWTSFSQNWFRPPMNSSPFYAVPGMPPDSTRNMGRLSSEQMIHPSGRDMKPPCRIPTHLNSYAIPQSFPLNHLPSVSSYYSSSPGHHDVIVPRKNSYLVVEHSAEDVASIERLNQLFEKTKSGGLTEDLTPQADNNIGLRFIDDKIIRPQRGRTVFSAKQLHELENVFITDQYISGQQRRRLSSQLGLTETQVRVWFQNRRIKWRKQKLERKIKA